MKKSLILAYIVVIVCMAVTTIIEKYQGTQYVSEHIYGAWWFSALWALLTALAIAWFIHRKVKRFFVILLHLSFVVILAGALTTHLTTFQGVVHLREGESTNRYMVLSNDSVKEKPLPFSIKMRSFKVYYHEGTKAPSDYVTQFTIVNDKDSVTGRVSMNNVFNYQGVRIYQNSFDQDMKGSILSINSDPYGIPITYLGYALLFISLVWMLIDPKGQYRRLLRQAAQMNRRTIILLITCLAGMQLQAAPTLPKETAQQLGQLQVLYNNRICPLQTLALDFTKKLYGKRYYKDADGKRYSAEQVLTGFIFWGDQWSNEPIVKIKGSALRDGLKLPKYCSVNTFFNQERGGYILGPYLQDQDQDKLHQEVLKVDDKLMLIMELRQGKLLKVFPYTRHAIIWYSPVDKYPQDIQQEQQEYMKNAFSVLYGYALSENWKDMSQMIAKMKKYQYRYGGNSIPSDTKIRAERIYNRIPFATILFMVNLTMGFLCLFLTIFQRRQTLPLIIMVLSFVCLTICLALRWIISGTIPMSNGYETMLFMAWSIQLLTLLIYRYFNIILTFGFLMSGFFLLVSHISQMDPNISHLMPVLSSPLLTIHVSIIMMGFALLSLTFICGIMGLLMRRKTDELHLLSQLFLFPALTCLGYGIFIGAIWANISWGTYWSWDPKETWALITFMIYGVAVHHQSIHWLNKPRNYHLYMTLAFMTILMTYFGVNYFLGGMHSYA